jgi:hypothetical protein
MAATSTLTHSAQKAPTTNACTSSNTSATTPPAMATDAATLRRWPGSSESVKSAVKAASPITGSGNCPTYAQSLC